MKVTLTLNGVPRSADVPPGTTLLELLRDLGAVSVKDGCANGDCGACAVLVDGRAVTACTLFAGEADAAHVTTVESLASPAGLHPLQQAMLDVGGVQCGFCTPGLLMAALDLLARDPAPTRETIRTALAGNLCRCTGYVKQIDAVERAAVLMQEGADG